MAEITLKSGKVLQIDAYKVTTQEWRKVTSNTSTVNDEDALISKCTGLTIDEIGNLPVIESRQIIKEIIRVILAPLADPN